jgi:hypothetical protein
LYVIKDDEIGRFSSGDDTSYEYTPLYKGVGGMPNSIIQVHGLIYMWDQAIGAVAFDGASFQELGYEIQPTWDTEKGLVGSGTVGPRAPLAVRYFHEKHEIAWLMSTFDPAPPAYYDDTYQLVNRERVLFLPTVKWVLGSGVGAFPTSVYVNTDPLAYQTSCDAVVGYRAVAGDQTAAGQALVDEKRGVYFTLCGRVDGKIVQCEKGSTFSPLASATFRAFFADSPEWTKQYRYIWICSIIPQGVSLVVKMGLLTDQVLKTVTTLTADSTRIYERWDRVEVPNNLFVNYRAGGGTKYLWEDRAVFVQLQSGGSGGNAGGLVIIALVAKSTDVQDHIPYP